VFWSTTEQIDFFIYNISKGKEKKFGAQKAYSMTEELN
jgi:hypothetical protein